MGFCSWASAAQPSLPQGVLTFHETVSGQAEVFVSVDGGKSARNLSQHPSEDLAASLSPDATRVAFQSGRAGKSHIFVVPVEGGAPLALTTGPHIDQSPSWAPDGKTIYFDSHRGDGWRLCSIAAAGGAVRVLTGSGLDALSPVCSPDGTRLACQVRRGSTDRWSIGLFDADGKLLREVVAGTSAFNETPCFSPDGRAVYFTSIGSDGYQLYRASVTDSVAPSAVTSFPGWKFHPVPVAGGAQLLFDEKTPQGWRLGLVDVATGAHATLPSTGPRFQPSWRDATKGK